VKETVSDKACEDQWGVHCIDKVQHTKKSDSDFQRGLSRWTSRSNYRRRTCVVTGWNRNQVVEISRLVSCESIICKRKEFIFDTFIY